MIIGISHSPSPYKIRMAGTEYNLRCGADIVLNGLQGDLEGESTCIVCGSKVRLKMQGSKLSQIEPGTAILHVVEIPGGPGRLQVDCEATPLFDKDECLRSWLRGYNGKAGTVYKPDEYVDHVTQGGKARVALRPEKPS